MSHSNIMRRDYGWAARSVLRMPNAEYALPFIGRSPQQESNVKSADRISEKCPPSVQADDPNSAASTAGKAVRTNRLNLAWAAALMFACAPGATASPAEVILLINGVTPDRGQLRVAICDQQTFLNAPCFKQVAVAVDATPQRLTLGEIPEGSWAVAIIYDLNGNERLDRNFLGMPKEPFGFSRNPAALFGPPDFKEAAFEVNGEPVLLSIELK